MFDHLANKLRGLNIVFKDAESGSASGHFFDGNDSALFYLFFIKIKGDFCVGKKVGYTSVQ